MNFKKQNIIATISGRQKCPKCGCNILEVLRGEGHIELYCRSWREKNIRCKYFKEVETFA